MHISCQSQTPTGDNYKTVVLLRLSNQRISISCLNWRKNEPNNNGGIELCLEINQDGYFGGTSSLTILRVFNISHIDFFANILFLDQIDIESI